MTAWLESAMRMLAAAGLLEAGSAFFGQSAIGQGGSGFSLPSFGDFNIVNGLEKKRRRRRRRALTASDKADIAFIAGILGKPAGKDIAAIIAARTG